MCRQVRGMPRSPISQVTWCAESGDGVQKSHCMSLNRPCLLYVLVVKARSSLPSRREARGGGLIASCQNGRAALGRVAGSELTGEPACPPGTGSRANRAVAACLRSSPEVDVRDVHEAGQGRGNAPAGGTPSPVIAAVGLAQATGATRKRPTGDETRMGQRRAGYQAARDPSRPDPAAGAGTCRLGLGLHGVVSLAVAATVFALLLPAELPDKTALASLLLGSRYRPGFVFAGAAAVFALHVAFALAV